MPQALHFHKTLNPTANKLLLLSVMKKTTYCEWPCGCRKPNYPYSTTDHQLRAATRTAFDSFAHSLETICVTQSAPQNPWPFRFIVRVQVQRSSGEKKRKQTTKEKKLQSSIIFYPSVNKPQTLNCSTQIKYWLQNDSVHCFLYPS